MAGKLSILIQPFTQRLRRRRFHFFLTLIKDLPRPLTILDIGGTEAYWEQVGLNEEGLRIILLNLEETKGNDPSIFSSIAGNATDLSAWPDQSIDLVFSNSVIEHLFTKENQCQMALEARRVGRSYFIQTPNYYFPIEPHWLFPFFQFLPRSWRIGLTRFAAWGHMPKLTDPKEAATLVDEVKMLRPSEMKALFPSGTLYYEKWLGITKSVSSYYIRR